MTQELTDQELREAQAFIALWKEFRSDEDGLHRLSKDAEEIATKAFSNTSRKISSASEELKSVIRIAGQMITDSVQLNREISARHSPEERNTTPMPRWVEQRIREMHGRWDRLIYANPAITPVLKMMLQTTTFRIELAQPAVDFFWQYCQRLDDADSDLLAVLKELRELFVKRVQESAQMRSAVCNAIKAWAEVSAARVEYLNQHGVQLGLNYQPVSIAAAKPARPLHVRRKTHNTPAPSPTLETKFAEEEQPWQAVCVSRTGTAIGSYCLLLLSNDDRIEEIFRQIYKWPAGIARTMVKKLKTLILISPDKRRPPNFDHGGILWRKLKAGKYRMLVHIKDNEQSVELFAGHRTKVYADIGRRKDES